MFNDRLRKNLDRQLLIYTIIIALIGVVVLFSSTRSDPAAAWKKQIIWLIMGSGALVGAAYMDYHIFARWSRHLFGLNAFMLLVVLKAHSINGAARWINIAGFKFQPSEFAKVLVILTLAAFLTERHEKIKEFGTFIGSLGYITLPMLLILRQPDLGTTLVVLAIWAGMVFIAGAKFQHMAILVVGGTLLFGILWSSGKVIRPYQKARVYSWMHPEYDKNGKGYHVNQAKTAIGSGQFLGKGFLQGTLVHGGYIPERQTDFIFTTIGEEFGFVGCVATVLVYGLLLFRGVMVVASAREDILGQLIAAGVVAMVAFHVILNIGMNIGILPAAGVPLPLISAGGSNVILILFCVGLLESVAIHRHQLMF